MAEPKQYTDYLLTVIGAGETEFTDVHIKILKPKTNGEKTRSLEYLNAEEKTYMDLPTDAHLPGIKLRDIKYAFDDYQDWAWSTKLAPWRKTSLSHPVQSIVELTRTKRIGHLYYMEPCDQECAVCPRYKEFYPDCKPSVVEPLHFSRIHRPSGRLHGQPVQMVPDWDSPGNVRPSLLELVTPRMLQNRVENGPKFYKEQYKSYRYGIIKALTGRWWLFVVVGIVAVVALLFLTGNLPGV